MMDNSFSFPRSQAPIPRPQKSDPGSGTAKTNGGTTRESSALRASVLDAALELGFGSSSLVTNWMFSNAVEEEEGEGEGELDQISSPGLTFRSTSDESQSSVPSPSSFNLSNPSTTNAGVPFPTQTQNLETLPKSTAPPFLRRDPNSNDPHQKSFLGVAQPGPGGAYISFSDSPLPPRSTTPNPTPSSGNGNGGLRKLKKKKSRIGGGGGGGEGYESDGGYISDAGKKKDLKKKDKKEKEKDKPFFLEVESDPFAPSSGRAAGDSFDHSSTTSNSTTPKEALKARLKEEKAQEKKYKEEERKRKKSLASLAKAAKKAEKEVGYETDGAGVSSSKAKSKSSKPADANGYETDAGYQSATPKKSKSIFAKLTSKGSRSDLKAQEEGDVPVPKIPDGFLNAQKEVVEPKVLPIASRFATTFGKDDSTMDGNVSRSGTPLPPPSLSSASSLFQPLSAGLGVEPSSSTSFSSSSFNASRPAVSINDPILPSSFSNSTSSSASQPQVQTLSQAQTQSRDSKDSGFSSGTSSSNRLPPPASPIRTAGPSIFETQRPHPHLQSAPSTSSTSSNTTSFGNGPSTNSHHGSTERREGSVSTITSSVLNTDGHSHSSVVSGSSGSGGGGGGGGQLRPPQARMMNISFPITRSGESSVPVLGNGSNGNGSTPQAPSLLLSQSQQQPPPTSSASALSSASTNANTTATPAKKSLRVKLSLDNLPLLGSRKDKDKDKDKDKNSGGLVPSPISLVMPSPSSPFPPSPFSSSPSPFPSSPSRINTAPSVLYPSSPSKPTISPPSPLRARGASGPSPSPSPGPGSANGPQGSGRQPPPPLLMIPTPDNSDRLSVGGYTPISTPTIGRGQQQQQQYRDHSPLASPNVLAYYDLPPPSPPPSGPLPNVPGFGSTPLPPASAALSSGGSTGGMLLPSPAALRQRLNSSSNLKHTMTGGGGGAGGGKYAYHDQHLQPLPSQGQNNIQRGRESPFPTRPVNVNGLVGLDARDRERPERGGWTAAGRYLQEQNGSGLGNGNGSGRQQQTPMKQQIKAKRSVSFEDERPGPGEDDYLYSTYSGSDAYQHPHYQQQHPHAGRFSSTSRMSEDAYADAYVDVEEDEYTYTYEEADDGGRGEAGFGGRGSDEMRDVIRERYDFDGGSSDSHYSREGSGEGRIPAASALGRNKSFEAFKNRQPLPLDDSTLVPPARPRPRPARSTSPLPPSQMIPSRTQTNFEFDNETVGDRTSRWSGSIYSRMSVMDEEESGETRERFVQRVEAMMEREKGMGMDVSVPRVPEEYLRGNGVGGVGRSWNKF